MNKKDKEKEKYIKEFIRLVVKQFPELKEDMNYKYDNRKHQFIIYHHDFNLQMTDQSFSELIRELTVNVLYKHQVLNFSILFERD